MKRHCSKTCSAHFWSKYVKTPFRDFYENEFFWLTTGKKCPVITNTLWILFKYMIDQKTTRLKQRSPGVLNRSWTILTSRDNKEVTFECEMLFRIKERYLEFIWSQRIRNGRLFDPILDTLKILWRLFI